MADSKGLVTRDAVIIVPGLMGSELTDRDGEPIWGLRPKLLFKELLTGSVLRRLAVGEDRLSGKDDGIHASRLLRFPVTLPGLTTIEPYTDLVAAVTDMVVHPDTVTVFPYDWRLSVAHNAELLGNLADDHLSRWRNHRHGSRDARLSLVCHSMGGLVARYFVEVLGGRADINHVIALGTPFAGSTKAARLISDGRILKFGALSGRLRTFGRTLPSVYELVPTYPCVETTGEPRAFTSNDLVALGASRDLVSTAETIWGRLHTVVNDPGYKPLPGLRPIVGTTQPTLSGVAISGGEATFTTAIGGREVGGDGTVYRASAFTAASQPASLPQRHGMLARSKEAIANVTAILTEQQLGPPQGDELGLDLPDDAVVGQPFEICAVAEAGVEATCRIFDADTNDQVRFAPLSRTSEGLRTTMTLPDEGLYWVELHGGGFSPVKELLFVAPDDTMAELR